MAFKMTPGMKGNPAAKRVAGLGACGGPGLPPCPPRFQQEKTTALVADRSSTSRSKSIRAKKKAAVVAPAPAPAPIKFKINLPKGYEFGSKKEEMNFYEMIQQGIAGGEFESQEQLDMAIMKQLKGGKPKDPKEPGGPIIVNPKEPVVVAPIKGGESEAVLSKPKAKSVAAK
tara:strand:+ start:1167 stop:1682 length:516 start_codon:yes stop_codon:yes gene_type:complete